MRLLSRFDLARCVVIGACLIALLSLGSIYAQRAMSFTNAYERCVESPEASEGKRVILSLWNVVAVADDSFHLAKVGPTVPVFGVEAAVEVGDVVSVEGRFVAGSDGQGHHVLADRFQGHPLRPYKAGFSLIGTFFALVYLAQASIRAVRRG